jgi:hypothetical protein
MLDFVESQSLQSIDYDINEAPLPGVEKDLVNLDCMRTRFSTRVAEMRLLYRIGQHGPLKQCNDIL